MSIQISAPVDQVWEKLSDLATHSEWMSDATTILFDGDQRRGVGVAMTVPTRVGPLRIVDTMEVDEWVEKERIGVKHTGRIGGWGRFELFGDQHGSILVRKEQLHFPWYMGGPVIEWFARPILRRIFRANLVSFGRWVESGLEPGG
ncbi:MAG: SRPBCC family protein [bacterium]|nr:SRPBCC family protein [Acidimicrobiia bacterium]MCY4650641.1 SRPBCC family protein [bacterium]